MNRRSFFKTSATTIGAIQAGLFAWADTSPEINTVLGPILAGNLGRALMHEHVMEDFVGADKIAPGRYDAEEVFRIALPYLRSVKALGCETLVECTPAYLGRDPGLLAQLSQASGLQIITNTGFYGAAGGKYVPRFAYSETVKEIAGRWVGEFRDGIPPTGIRAGFIKIGVDAGPLSEINAKLVSAAALTHLQTGLVIASHTGDGVAAMAQLALLKKHAVPPSAFIWVHAQDEKNTNLRQRAVEEGAWIEFDGISEESLNQNVAWVVEMKQAGYLEHVLISQDAGWYHVGEARGGSFRGYDSLFTQFLPELRRAGLKESDVRTLIIDNPRRALTLSH
jgi:predicted metal-dependent phosphotriesterase family hydrolase